MKKFKFLTASVPENKKGHQLENVEQVIRAAVNKKCLVYRGARVPAAFLCNFQAMFLYREIKAGLLFYYIIK